jgi:hypothetical protein
MQSSGLGLLKLTMKVKEMSRRLVRSRSHGSRDPMVNGLHHQPDTSAGAKIFTTKLQYFLPTVDLVIVSSSKFNLYWQGLF